MKVAFGLKAHSGWAALVVLGEDGREICVVERRRLELVEPEEAVWAKQPYHAAEDLPREEARVLVDRGVASAHRIAAREVKRSITRISEQGHEVVACAVLMGAPMSDWSTDEILDVHFRMHKAEGVLFRDALARAAEACNLRLVAIPEKQLAEYTERAFDDKATGLRKQVDALGKMIGPPWGKDQKDAALAALIAIRSQSK